MRRLHRQAILFFLLPLLALLGIGMAYVLSGQLRQAIEHGPTWVDLVSWALLLLAALIPSVWGYRLADRMATALAHTTAVARRVAEGDFSQNLAAWAAESSELFALEESINATALHLQAHLTELGAQKSRLEAILHHMTDGVLLVDSRKRLMLINPAAAAIFAIEAADVVGKDHLEVTHLFQLDEAMDRVVKNREPAVLEIKRARPGEQVLEARLVPAGEGVLLVLRDVTRSRKLEQMRSDFVANVTHELRTPLTAIRGFAETLLEGALEDPETARQFVSIIKCESENLGELIEDLLELSRIESGKWKVVKEPIHLAQLVERAVSRLRPRAKELGVDLRVAVGQELPPILGDPARLSQVLVNLVDNALKYTPGGGSVTVTAEEQPSTLSISIADTGTGIPKADLPRIFERFYRVDKARARATGGTGLGLSIAKHIVEAHGGTIGVISDTGQGATFTFTLPKSLGEGGNLTP